MEKWKGEKVSLCGNYNPHKTRIQSINTASFLIVVLKRRPGPDDVINMVSAGTLIEVTR